MSTPGSVSNLIAALKTGDHGAAQPLWERYNRHLLALARKMLRAASLRAADEEDVVQNAFHSFFRAITQGRFAELSSRNSLLRLLVDITAHKALKQIAHEQRQKRGGGTIAAQMGIYSLGRDNEVALLQQVGVEPAPDVAAQIADNFRRLLDLLNDETLRRVAVWKMEGYSSDEIADMLVCSRRTVARKLEAIRILWRKEHVL